MNVYWPDHDNERLWIFMPKVASTSISQTVGCEHRVDRETALKYRNYFTIAFVRHPWDRLTSALFNNLRDLGPIEERVTKWILWPASPDRMDMHVRPQWWFLDGFDVDFLGHFETLGDDWKRLQTLIDVPDLEFVSDTKGPYRPDGIAAYDWVSLGMIYHKDLLLCPDSA